VNYLNNTKVKSDSTIEQIALVHLGKREKSGLKIFEKLQQYSYAVTEFDVVDELEEFTYTINNFKAVVVNIGSVNFEYDNFLADLFEKDFKVIINEASLTNDLSGLNRASWERHLLNKIDSKFSLFPNTDKSNNSSNTPLDLSIFGIKSVWILAASIGGPQAIKEFLSGLKVNQEILFIVIQHMDKEFVPNLVQQLNEVSSLIVKFPISGMALTPSVLIYPTDESMTINDQGRIELKVMNEEPAFVPCIDLAVEKLVKTLKNINIAVFSGMCTDGIKAANLVKLNGGKVILQSEESCVLSTIISGIKQNMNADLEASPKELANYVMN
jgi:hypothetical protein